jgi:hypothetical protein
MDKIRNIISTIVRPDDKERVIIVRRDDGLITYQRQWQEMGGWGDPGPDCGIYESQETAEAEAKSRIWWVREMLGDGSAV